MTSTAKDDRLVWIDLEMTGLDPGREVILEVATLVTDQHLEVLAEGPSLVIHHEGEVLERMIPVVRAMHEKNGLLHRVKESQVTPEQAEQRTLAFIRQHCTEKSAPLCGNTIWMDRMFLNRQMPSVDAYLHYRVIDVSSIKELARRWNPAALAKAPAKPDSHRALDDIRASIEELRHYRQAWLETRHGESPAEKRVD